MAETTERRTYQLGFPDPITIKVPHATFSAVDTRLVAVPIEVGEREVIGFIQGLSFERDLISFQVKGSILFEVLDWFRFEEIINKFAGQYLFKIECNNEYGSQAQYVLKNLKLTKEYFAIGVDDILVQSSVDFTAINTNGWEPFIGKE